MVHAATFKESLIMAKKKNESNQPDNSEVVESVVTDSVENSIIRKKIETMKAEAAEKVALELELKELQHKANRTGGDPITLAMGTYNFRQILDPGVSFTGTFGHPVTEGGRNKHTRYCCEDGADIELPVKYVKDLNHCSYPEPVWTTDDSGNAVKKQKTNLRWIFTKIEG